MSIVLARDWKRYPRAIPDTRTTNTSWLELAKKYKAMGVKNHTFILALHNPALQGVDPHSPDLSLKQMVMISDECSENLWYYLREVARVPAQAGDMATPFEASRSIVALAVSFLMHGTVTLTQPRQTGKTFGTANLMIWLLNHRGRALKINLLTKDDRLRTENIKLLKEIYAELPAYLQFRDRTDVNNNEEFGVKKLKNFYNTAVPQSSEKAAYNVGRGLTAPIFHIDEPPFQPHIKTALTAALPAMIAATDKAAAANGPYGLILTTTAGKRDDRDGKYIYKEYVSEAAPWTEHFLDAVDEADFERMVRTNARGGNYRIYAAFTHRQLGKSDTWMRKKLELTGLRGEDANRDMFNVWTAGSQTSPLPPHLIELMQRHVRPEEHQEISRYGGYVLRWQIPKEEIASFMATRKTILGVDTSDGGGGDDISLVLIDVLSGATMAVATLNELSLLTFGHFLIDLIERYKNMTVIIERKSSGPAIIDHLLEMLPVKGIDPFQRLFNWVAHEPKEHPVLAKEMLLPLERRAPDVYVRAKGQFGFGTSGSGKTSRSDLYSTILQNAAKRCGDKVRDRALIEQISGLVIRNGRVDHDIGGHDDLVIGWLLAHWLMTMGKNLSHYGIDPRSVLAELQKTDLSTPQQAYQHHEQLHIRQEIDQIYQQLLKESNPYLLERLEQRLRVLDKRMVLQDHESFSVDRVIAQAKETRQQQQRSAYQQQREQDVRHGYGYASFDPDQAPRSLRGVQYSMAGW